jgi:predicted phosphoribosyltransferase
MPTFFTDREEAGRLLASCLTEYTNRSDSALVMGISNGGVAVGSELARALRIPLRPLSSPGSEIRDRAVILVDEVIASPDEMRNGIAELRRAGAIRVVAAAPLLSREVLPQLWQAANDVAFLMAPMPLGDPAHWFHRYPPVTDAEVADLLLGRRAAVDARRHKGRGSQLVQLRSD